MKKPNQPQPFEETRQIDPRDFSASPTSRDSARSVLVLKPSSLGDVIHTLPAVAWLKAERPEWRFSWLVNSEWRPLLEGNPAIEEIIEFPRREFRGALGWRKLLPWLRARVMNRRPDLALDFQGLLRTALIGRASGAGELIGLADAREGAGWFYHRAAPTPAGVPHAVERYLALAALVLDGSVDASSPDFSRALPLQYPLPMGSPPPGLESELRFYPSDYVLLHPFSRGKGKSLTTKQVYAICRQLLPTPVILAGRTSGEDLRFLPPGCLNLLNRTTLPQLIWLIRRASFVISVDSGPMHLAAALGKPLVAVHTWSDPRRVGPYRADAWVWKSGRLLLVADFRATEPGFFTAPPAPLSVEDVERLCEVALAGAKIS